MSVVTQSLNAVVDITVTVEAVAAAAPLFNQGLVVGTSAVIPTYSGTNPRVQLFESLNAILTAGFTTTEPEYLAAEAYFGQSPAPQYLWIGRQDLTGIKTLTIAAGGTGYAVGQVITVTQAGASHGTATVATITVGGVVASLTIVTAGTGYAIANSLATTVASGTGSGLQVDVTALGETALQAITACRIASQSWYIGVVLAAVDADHEAIAPYIEAATPPSLYFYASQDLTGACATVLQAAGYTRTLGITSTTQGSVYPGNLYAQCALMGVALGLNSGLANSYYALKFKALAGIAVEPLTTSQVTTLEGLNTNLYLNYSNAYNWVEQGVMASGAYFDDKVGIDQLVANLQSALVAVLVAQPSVPQTNAGETLFINAANAVCAAAVTQGFLAPGVWEGQTVLSLTAGTTLVTGYLVQAQSYALQTASARAARQAMPLYICVTGAGAVGSLAVALIVQQ